MPSLGPMSNCFYENFKKKKKKKKYVKLSIQSHAYFLFYRILSFNKLQCIQANTFAGLRQLRVL